MNDEPLKYQLGLGLIPGIGQVLARNLVSYCGGVQEVFMAKEAQLLKVPGISKKKAKSILSFELEDAVSKELAFIKKHNIQTFFYLDKDYPERLKQLHDAPLMLHYLGNTNLNRQRMVAVIGTRKASTYGKDFCERFLEELKPYDCCVVSGLAYGIDICAHKQALKLGMETLGVLGHGLDTLYPAQHKATAQQMIKQGGLITESLSGTKPDKQNFPKRNRIIAGMCDAVVVIESGKRGGAIITAEIANSYDRDVFALPGRIGDVASEGCNHLIKVNKASMIEKAEDLAYLMNWQRDSAPLPPQSSLPLNLSSKEQALVSLLREQGACEIDFICRFVNSNQSEVALSLLDLEFKGILRSLPGKRYELL